MPGKKNCTICRKLLPGSEKENQEWEYSCWKNQCAESLCHVLLGTSKEYSTVLKYFQNGNYCTSCLQMVRDVDFSWRQMKHIAKRGSQLLSLILLNFQTNYQNNKKETVFDEKNFPSRSTKPNSDDAFDFDNYSYNNVSGIIYSASKKLSINSPLSVFVKHLLEQMPISAPNFTKIKLELEDDEESDVWYDQVDNQNDITSDQEYKCILNEEDVGQQKCKRKIEPMSDAETSSKSDDSLGLRLNRKSKRISLKPSTKNASYSCVKKEKYSKRLSVISPGNQRIECPISQKHIRKRHNALHQRIHSGERPFKCSECEWDFYTKPELGKHLRNLHGKLHSPTAGVKSASLAAEVENEFISRKRSYHCHLCSSTFNLQYNYLRHLKDIHLNKDVQDGDAFHFHYCDADGCLLSFESLSILRSHIESHITDIAGDRNQKHFHVCNICERCFVQEENLKTHIRSHEEGSCCCDYCHLSFSSQNDLELHKPRHRIVFKMSYYSHLCEECGNGFPSVYLLNRHIKTKHNNMSRPRGPKAKKVQCPYCEATLQPKSLQRHISRHHHRPQYDLALPPMFKGQQTYCGICNKKFGQKSHYRRHVVNTHPEEYQKTHPYFCKFCFCVFASESERDDHVEKSHNGFACTFENCNKKFISQLRLGAHMNVHTKKKPYVCPHCQQGFSNDGNCLRHINIVHNKHRSILCKLCPENVGFYIRKEFNKHVSRVHPEINEKDYPSVLQRNKSTVPVIISKINLEDSQPA